MSGSNSFTDVTTDMISYNSIRFNNLSESVANNNNRNTYQYYLRVYVGKYIKDMVNLNIRYLELSNISINNQYLDYSSARSLLPILYSNIVLYNDSATLFTTDDLINSGYGDFYIEYIDFNIANYDFKSSTYYNSNLGILGYISNTYITASSFNFNEYYYNGYNDGEKIGYDYGYNDGYANGVASNTNSFDQLMFAVADVPVKIISSILNFNVLGVNLLAFFTGIITLVLFVHLLRKFKQ